MSDSFTCWKCANELKNVILPMSRREECPRCGSDQHVCKACVFFVRGRCDEEQAEDVSDTERANFCDYFKPSSARVDSPNSDKAQLARAELAALFGDEVPAKEHNDQSLSAAELAEKKLRDMLNGF